MFQTENTYMLFTGKDVGLSGPDRRLRNVFETWKNIRADLNDK
jgi:hypothetical protein